MRFRPLTPLAALLLLLPGQVVAQVSLETRATVASAFVWRGLTIVSRPVVQPEATLSAGPASIGLWANVEPAAYHGAALSALAGRHAPGLTEVDPSLDLGHTVAGVELAAGAIGYLFTHQAGYETLPNTVELYGRVQLPGALPLALAGYYDAHALHGLYLEAGLERGLPGWPALQVGGRVGASVGEANGESAYYERNGLTHAEFTATLPVRLGPVRLEPAANLDFNIDGATRVTSLTGSHRAKLWVGAAVVWPGKEE